MESFAGTVAAGILVSLLNRYVLDFKWCNVVENWCKYGDDEDEKSDMMPSSSTAIPTVMHLMHHR